ncbi:CBD9-like protein [Mollisia scopiformis]|uniref:CBD9-like protein n=1 Tax=Mollisia scopiformis TaxID=149040 RepID=A0A194XDH8_MOLSC|nr:CBD9-like protein [Mollisia scopiformis]KUJ18209.1 CBD9-like protein [Mollisia scopiformis]
MGSQKMKNSLMFMMYTDSTKNNITLSPRLSYDHSEPSYTSNVNITILSGTGISNNQMVINAMCENCRSWKGGEIDPTNTKASFIWANGPTESLTSDSLTADIKMHADYGVFQLDLTQAVGAAGVPVIATTDSSGSKQISYKTSSDGMVVAHAIFTILAFVAIMPLGVLILRIFKSPKWHGYNQGASFVIALVGLGLGFGSSTEYNRSKNFSSAHQLFGIAITIALAGQFVLGYMHHKVYKKTLATTKLAPIHVLLGRLVIPAGILNAFLGFPLALESASDGPLFGIVVAVVIILGAFSWWSRRRDEQHTMAIAARGSELGYR